MYCVHLGVSFDTSSENGLCQDRERAGGGGELKGTLQIRHDNHSREISFQLGPVVCRRSKMPNSLLTLLSVSESAEADILDPYI